jgi:hypothetical protein
MSNLNTGVANYGGRQPDNVQNIKQFNNTSPSIVLWMYKKISEIMYITPCDQVNDVLIPRNLYVHGSINSTSDTLLKENVEQLTSNECDKIMDLQPKKYTFIDDATKKTHYGLIAQEVEEQYPLLVSEIDGVLDDDADTKIKTVNYMELIPIMIRKMQNMQNEIDELREKLILLT